MESGRCKLKMCQPHYLPGKVVRANQPQRAPAGPSSALKQHNWEAPRARDGHRGAWTIRCLCGTSALWKRRQRPRATRLAGDGRLQATATARAPTGPAPVSYLQLLSTISCRGPDPALRQTLHRALLRRHAKHQLLSPFQEFCCIKTPARLTPVQPTRHQYLPARVLEQRGVCSLLYQPYSLG